MKCEKMEELISALVDDELDAREARVVERHLQDCRSCRLAAKRLAALKSAVKHAEPARAPEDLRDALFAAAGRRRVENRPPARAPAFSPPRWGWGMGLTTTAACAAAVAVVVLAGRTREEVVPVDFMLAAHDAYAMTLPLAGAEELTPELVERLSGAGAAP